MAEIDAIKEEIGWLKVVLAILSAIEVSLLGWLAQNHATAGVLLGLGAFLVAVAFAAGVVWVNFIVYGS